MIVPENEFIKDKIQKTKNTLDLEKKKKNSFETLRNEVLCIPKESHLYPMKKKLEHILEKIINRSRIFSQTWMKKKHFFEWWKGWVFSSFKWRRILYYKNANRKAEPEEILNQVFNDDFTNNLAESTSLITNSAIISWVCDISDSAVTENAPEELLSNPFG